jgi:hypothetical protein
MASLLSRYGCEGGASYDPQTNIFSAANRSVRLNHWVAELLGLVQSGRLASPSRRSASRFRFRHSARADDNSTHVGLRRPLRAVPWGSQRVEMLFAHVKRILRLATTRMPSLSQLGYSGVGGAGYGSKWLNAASAYVSPHKDVTSPVHSASAVLAHRPHRAG